VATVFNKVFGWVLSSKEPKVELEIYFHWFTNTGFIELYQFSTFTTTTQIGHMGATLELQRQEQIDQWEQEYVFNRAGQNFRTNRGQGYAERLIGSDNADEGMLGRLFRQRQNRTTEPSEENIQILVDMGFNRDRAREALSSSNNNLETATSILLRQ